jgi:hypothetical protein
MLSFLNSPLLWGLAAVGVPVIIHLINLLRHRRVKWAAMEFLLAGQRKHSTWIKLKEMLLLLMRMAAIAAVVLIVARPRLDGGIGKRLGDVTTHHVVLLDDSFSMSDRFAERNVFDQAKAAVERIAQTALEESSNQTFTLLRTSQAAASNGAPKPDIFQETVNAEFVFRDRTDRKLNRVLETLSTSEDAAGPEAALKSLATLLKPAEDEERILYLVSDFRERDWANAAEMRNQLANQEKRTAQMIFVNCVDADRPNLAVTSLAPLSGTSTAGVWFKMRLEVRNYGLATSERVTVEIRSGGDTGGGSVFLDPIPPGKSGIAMFDAFFSDPGEHRISVELAGDAVAADNRRYCVLNLPAKMPVLVVDGNPQATDAADVAKALAPAGPVASGIAPTVQSPAFLIDDENHRLADYWAVYLVNVKKLEAAAVRNLEAYAKGGGGVCFVLGNQTSADFFNNDLYREGDGLFPVALDAEKQLFRDREAKAFDIVGTPHPVFAPFADERNSFLRDVTINRYFGVVENASGAEKASATIAAKLRNGAPLAVERRFGEGRVMALTTVPSLPWSDWKNNASFVVAVLETQSYIARRDALRDEARLVGAPISVVLDPKLFLPTLKVQGPKASQAPAEVTGVAVPEGLKFEYPDVSQAGFYTAELTRLDKTAELRTSAVNVDAAEGDLRRVGEAELNERLGGIRFQFRSADRVQPAETESSSSLLSTVILYALVALLLGEQALAYVCSYHAPAKGAVA